MYANARGCLIFGAIGQFFFFFNISWSLQSDQDRIFWLLAFAAARDFVAATVAESGTFTTIPFSSLHIKLKDLHLWYYGFLQVLNGGSYIRFY